MGIDSYQRGVRKRRKERLRLLKEKKRKEAVSHTYSSHLDRRERAPLGQVKHPSFKHKRELGQDEIRLSPFLLKVMAALLLVLGSYIVMESDNPQWSEIQQVIQFTLEEDIEVSQLTEWYEQTVGMTPDLFPQVIQRQDGTQEMPEEYSVPVSGGAVLTPFDQDQQGIVVNTHSTLPVEGVKEGWVTFVGERDDSGLTVIIDHGGDEESWYGHLQDVHVQLHDWVQQGEVVGTTSVKENGEAQLYFALKKDDIFVDPLDVISFD